MKHRAVRVLIFILAAAGLVWFLIPLHWRVINAGSVLGMAVCSAVLLVCLFYLKIRRKCVSSKAARILCRSVMALFCAGLAWAAFLTGLMVAGTRSAPPENATVVVLGSKVSGSYPSADLTARIQAAGAYLAAHPSAKCVASGGKGPGEAVTEASVIREYLVRQGIDPARILEEDQSTTTRENLANSLSRIDRQGWSRELAIVTDEYHQYRAGRIARSLGAQPYAVCARTPWYIFSACYARELLALTQALLFT